MAESAQLQVQETAGIVKDPTNGRFVKGHSGNPTGVSKEKKSIIEMCKNMSEDVINVLYDIVMDEDKEHNGSTRIMAGQEILNRGFGKPGIRKEETEDDGPIIPNQMIITMSKEDFDEYEQEHKNDIQ